uniref:NADH dehydrogenase [ubiquinone] flavoprotein 3, mitochondrial n=1 Tax=Chrysemys picta bellii TaxID=8478 RepID=A0A8C3P4Z4_CHRPI
MLPAAPASAAVGRGRGAGSCGGGRGRWNSACRGRASLHRGPAHAAGTFRTRPPRGGYVCCWCRVSPRRWGTGSGDTDMAASSLLGCGRAMTRKTLQLEAWGLRSFSPFVSLCTKSEGSKKGQEKKTKTAAASAQEEFDNSTYKNLQHHEYNMYTFVDFDVELSQFRQPQPSSGRLSPRH